MDAHSHIWRWAQIDKWQLKYMLIVVCFTVINPWGSHRNLSTTQYGHYSWPDICLACHLTLPTNRKQTCTRTAPADSWTSDLCTVDPNAHATRACILNNSDHGPDRNRHTTAHDASHDHHHHHRRRRRTHTHTHNMRFERVRDPYSHSYAICRWRISIRLHMDYLYSMYPHVLHVAFTVGVWTIYALCAERYPHNVQLNID